MESDELGFSHPSIDATRCIACGACDAACPVLNVPDEDQRRSVRWAKAHDDGLLKRSSSGGVFGLLASDVLSRGGVVAGAAWAEGCQSLRHIVVGDEAGLDDVMRSKYVQSSVGREVYEGVRDALRSRRPVLFAGTACQVAAMRSYLATLADSDLFLGVDVICHGVPSPKLWREWLDYVKGREGADIQDVNFRSKVTGWLSFSIAYEFAAERGMLTRASSTVFRDDWYMRAFLGNASLRTSCLTCPFKGKCGSDITLGDFWGIQRQHPNVSVVGGVSAIVCSSSKGEAAVSRVASSMDSGESSFEKVAAGNSALVRPVRPYPDRIAFMGALADDTAIEEMMTRWDFNPRLRQMLFARAKGAIKRLLRRA